MTLQWDKLDLRGTAETISSHLDKHGIEAVLVGGACVSIYSRNAYLSHDFDFVTGSTLKQLDTVLAGLGFKRAKGRLYEKAGCDFVIDFVAPPIAVGDEPVREFTVLKSSTGILKLLSPTDCVKDRLSAYYHWNDPQSLEQAVMVARTQRSKVDLKQIESWSAREEHLPKFQTFKLKVERRVVKI